MITIVEQLAARLERLYALQRDVPPADLLDGLQVSMDDDSLAEIIDVDGRLRLDHGLPVTPERYLKAAPDLARRPVALDAAIEFSLRWLNSTGLTPADAVERLVQRYPQFQAAIRAASLLNEALWSTSEVHGMQPAAELRPPCDFGPILPSGVARYEIRELIGRGAQGAVYRAVDRHLSDPARPAWVAIKLLGRQIAEGGRSRLIEEATRARRVTNAHVVRVLDRGVSADAQDYIVYEYVEGVSLRQWLQDHPGPVGARRAAELLIQIARGVQAAHAVGILHCDLKPDNVLMTSSGEPKVTDFGLAIRLEDQAAPGSTGGRVGNLGFTAPEQYRLQEDAFSVATDIYALGGLLYYLLTGRVPNGQTPEEAERNLGPGGRTTAPDPAEFRRGLDPSLAQICRRALAVLPQQRYGSAEGLALDLEAWLRHEPLGWMKLSASRKLRLFCRREPLAALLALAVVVCIAGATGVAVALKHRGERQVLQERMIAVNQRARQQDEWHDRLTTMSGIVAQTWMAQRAMEADWMTTLTILEVLVGPKLLSSSDDWQQLWRTRIDAARRLADLPRQEGREMDLHAMMWQTILGLFLLNERRIDEAVEILTENRARWAALLRPDDSHLRSIDRMLRCADILSVTLMTAQERRQGENWQRLTDAVDFLEQQVQSLERHQTGDGVHRLILECLEAAYAGDLLDRPADRQAIQRWIRRLDSPVQAPGM